MHATHTYAEIDIDDDKMITKKFSTILHRKAQQNTAKLAASHDDLDLVNISRGTGGSVDANCPNL